MTRSKKTEEALTNVAESATLVRSQPSVELKRDGKGSLSCTVKAYADTMAEAIGQAVKAMDEVVDYFDTLEEAKKGE